MSISVNGRRVREHVVEGSAVALATAGSAFEVVVSNDNHATYLVRLCVDGVEADPGYTKKVRGDSSAIFKGWICKRDVHEFLFAKTPVQDDNPQGQAPGVIGSLGSVRAEIYSTRRVRIESSSSSDESDSARRSSAALAMRALPEKMATKTIGVQSAAGGAIDYLRGYRRRRRGDYRLEKVKPACCTLTLLYRDSFWCAQMPAPAASLMDIRVSRTMSMSMCCVSCFRIIMLPHREPAWCATTGMDLRSRCSPLLRATRGPPVPPPARSGLHATTYRPARRHHNLPSRSARTSSHPPRCHRPLHRRALAVRDQWRGASPGRLHAHRTARSEERQTCQAPALRKLRWWNSRTEGCWRQE